MEQEMVSFVLRFVREVGDDQQARWRGVVKHVQGDAQENFTQFSQALDFMQSRVNEIVRASFAGPGQLPDATLWTETARLWGELVPQYTQLMADTMEQTVSANTAMARQMQQSLSRALAAWGVPGRPAERQAPDQARAVEELKRRIEALTAQISELEARLAAQQGEGNK
jgi:polyhydroxyalkanoate synthesis regulator phasin